MGHSCLVSGVGPLCPSPLSDQRLETARCFEGQGFGSSSLCFEKYHFLQGSNVKISQRERERVYSQYANASYSRQIRL